MAQPLSRRWVRAGSEGSSCSAPAGTRGTAVLQVGQSEGGYSVPFRKDPWQEDDATTNQHARTEGAVDQGQHLEAVHATVLNQVGRRGGGFGRRGKKRQHTTMQTSPKKGFRMHHKRAEGGKQEQKHTYIAQGLVVVQSSWRPAQRSSSAPYTAAALHEPHL